MKKASAVLLILVVLIAKSTTIPPVEAAGGMKMMFCSSRSVVSCCPVAVKKADNNSGLHYSPISPAGREECTRMNTVRHTPPGVGCCCICVDAESGTFYGPSSLSFQIWPSLVPGRLAPDSEQRTEHCSTALASTWRADVPIYLRNASLLC
jgi:hypothetical protein